MRVFTQFFFYFRVIFPTWFIDFSFNCNVFNFLICDLIEISDSFQIIRFFIFDFPHDPTFTWFLHFHIFSHLHSCHLEFLTRIRNFNIWEFQAYLYQRYEMYLVRLLLTTHPPVFSAKPWSVSTIVWLVLVMMVVILVLLGVREQVFKNRYCCKSKCINPKYVAKRELAWAIPWVVRGSKPCLTSLHFQKRWNRFDVLLNN